MGTRIQKVSTIGGGNVNVFPVPIIAQRAPVVQLEQQLLLMFQPLTISL